MDIVLEPFQWKEPVSWSSSDHTIREIFAPDEAKTSAHCPRAINSEANRKVIFSDEVTTIGASCIHKGQWHFKRDMILFSEQAQAQIRRVQFLEEESENPFFWTKNLHRIFDSFQAMDCDLSGLTSKAILGSNRVALDATCVGLESACVPDIARELLKERKAFVREILALQEQTDLSRATRACLMRKSSVRRSRVVALFAHYIAKQSARHLSASAV